MEPMEAPVTCSLKFQRSPSPNSMGARGWEVQGAPPQSVPRFLSWGLSETVLQCLVKRELVWVVDFWVYTCDMVCACV